MDQQHNHEELDKVLTNYKAIERNSEFLTFVRKLVDPDSIAHLPMLKDYSTENSKLAYENFAQLLIQLTYMVYTCKYYGLNPHIQPEGIRVEPAKKFTIVVYYKIVEEAVSSGYYSSVVQNILEHLLGFYMKELANDEIGQKQKIVEYLDSFIESIKIFRPILENMNGEEKDHKFFLLLEETDLFRDHSLLLKIQNNSIVDFIRPNIEWFREFRKRDIQAVQVYISSKKKNNYDPTQLKNKQGAIDQNLKKFLEEFAEKINGKIYDLKEADNDHIFKLKKKLCFEENISKKTAQNLVKIDSRFSNVILKEGPVQTSNFFEYHIEYSAQNNSICVKLIPHSLILNLITTDYMFIQSSALTFDTGNISIVMTEIKTTVDTETVTKKALAFRGSSCFTNKEPPLEKILVLMDLTMLAAKVYQPELNINKTGMWTSDYERVSLVAQKMDHYSKMLLKCAKKVYNE